MKIRAQIGKVLNLDKCIGCHTCSVTCKQVWTTRQGIEYAWWNNVESKPGIGYPKDWENQERWRGGWVLGKGGSLRPKTGGKWRILSKIFANPELPEIDDYYEPFDYEYLLHPRRARKRGGADSAARLDHHRRAHGQGALGAELGGEPWHRVPQAREGLQF